MQKLDQPPPDLPAPPPGIEAQRSRRIFAIILWIGSICALLLLLAYPVIFGTRRGYGNDRTEIMNNALQIRLLLSEFDSEYGCFPDASTISKVKESTGTALTLGDGSSNKLFRQLIAYGLKSEKPFWAKTKDTPKKPDNIFDSDRTALAPGECGFAYVAGLSSKDDPDTPVLLTPMLKGQTKFDRSQDKGKAVILFLDSARVLPIEKDGRVLINGMDIFDPRQPFCKGKAPDIKWPE